jgi:heme-degrading monooxygenase HmoA
VSVRLIVEARVAPDAQAELARSYRALRERAEQEPALISHQLCQSTEDAELWLVISEWDSADASARWDASEDHARLLAPLRACFAQATRSSFLVRDGSGYP